MQPSNLEGTVIRFLSTAGILSGKLGVVKRALGENILVAVAGYGSLQVKPDQVEAVTDELSHLCPDHLDLSFVDIKFDFLSRLEFVRDKFKVNLIQGKGLGVVAVRRILRGERVLQDFPIIEVHSEAPMPHKLPDGADENAFWSLSDVHTGHIGKTLRGIVETNCYPLGAEEDVGGVFPVLSRFNHSCAPNTAHCWLPELGCEVIHAITDIEVGEELTVSYADPYSSQEVRKKMLFDSFRFTCCCDSCSLRGIAERRSDIKRRRLSELVERTIGTDSAETLRLAHEALDIIDREFKGRPGYKVQHYRTCSQAALEMGNVRLAMFYAHKDYEGICLDEGSSSVRARASKRRQSVLEKLPAVVSFNSLRPCVVLEMSPVVTCALDSMD